MVAINLFTNKIIFTKIFKINSYRGYYRLNINKTRRYLSVSSVVINETKKNNDDSFPVPAEFKNKNRGVADRARLDDCARAEADFASSADGVRFALAKKAETYKSLLLRKTFGARDGYGVDFDAKSAADAASFRDAEAPPFAEVPPPPPGGPRVDDAALVAKKRQRLLALKNRGRERTTTAADGADA